MSYEDRYIAPGVVKYSACDLGFQPVFNASHTDEEIRTWQEEQTKTDQMELPLTNATVQPASTTDFEKNSAASEQHTELDSTQSA